MEWNVGEKLSFFGKQIIAFGNLYPTNLMEYNRIKEKGLRGEGGEGGGRRGEGGGDPRRNLIIFYRCWKEEKLRL